ncbi:hypothetical protein DYB37_010813 [Aphanomyces astaci]|uniref:PH domain-containing protein n=2 Tax=Aphanomyces astaci TaxID=112090 RepID=A0A3R7ER66_APHAT|nr:hypothetical protein DYB35_001298 [Aphanomyces astaci]RHZ11340.1 hypothetical protein DYB37_010813 [Aphanomyces astaci]
MTQASQLAAAATARRRGRDIGTPIMDEVSYTPDFNEPPSPHATPDSDLSGWLWMRSSLLGRWRHRYFSFAHGLLSYFESFPSEEFLKQQTLSSSSQPGSPRHFLHGTIGTGAQPRGVLRVAHIEEINNKLGFKVFAASGKVIEIRAPRSDIRQTWLAALRATAITRSRSWSASNHHHHPHDHLSPSGKAVSLGFMRATDPLHGLLRMDPTQRDTLRIDKCGWLLKRSDILRRWNRYYFVLQDRMLSYYVSDKPYAVPRRRGYIQGARREPNKHDSVVVVSLSAGHDLHLRLPHGSTSDCLSDWFDVLVATAMLPQDHIGSSSLRHDAARLVSNDSTDDSIDQSFI